MHGCQFYCAKIAFPSNLISHELFGVPSITYSFSTTYIHIHTLYIFIVHYTHTQTYKYMAHWKFNLFVRQIRDIIKFSKLTYSVECFHLRFMCPNKTKPPQLRELTSLLFDEDIFFWRCCRVHQMLTMQTLRHAKEWLTAVRSWAQARNSQIWTQIRWWTEIICASNVGHQRCTTTESWHF